MEIQGNAVKMQIGSGGSCNVLPKKYLPVGTEVQKTNKFLTAYNKEQILAFATLRACDCNFGESQDRTKKSNFFL